MITNMDTYPKNWIKLISYLLYWRYFALLFIKYKKRTYTDTATNNVRNKIHTCFSETLNFVFIFITTGFEEYTYCVQLYKSVHITLSFLLSDSINSNFIHQTYYSYYDIVLISHTLSNYG